MTEKIALYIFWICMLLCASTVLSIVWVPFVETGAEPPLRGQLAMTFFVVGFAAALIWSPLVVYRFYSKIYG